MILANKTKQWPLFLPPKEKASLTVLDVVNSPDNRKKEMIMKWAESVWNTWKPNQEEVAELVKKYLI